MAEPLSAEQADELFRQLLCLQEEIKKLLNDSHEAAKPVDLREPIGRLSRMDAIAGQSMAKANKEKLTLKGRQVEASLQDYKQRHYGSCRSCKYPIGYPRLAARPEAPFCISCQTAFENRTK